MFGKKNDKRIVRRIPVECQLEYKAVNNSKYKHAIAKNISKKGVFFVADEQCEVGTMLEIKVAATESMPAHEAIIEVIRVNPAPGNKKFEIAGLIKVIK
jgi:selenocysteine lyase/cysteine desulfurase